MLGVLLAALLACQDDALLEAQRYDRDAFESLFDQYYEAGKTYYRNSRRREAVWFLKRSLQIRPELTSLKRFVDLLQDYDNPVWRKKRWKSPRDSADRMFQKKAAALDGKYLERMLKVGERHARDEALHDHADGWFRQALQLAGGPYPVDRKNCVVVGDAGVIPEDASARLLERDLVRINGELWLRDSMLRALPDVNALSEARSERCLVRVVGPVERAQELLEVMEQARAALIEHEGLEVERLLGLFVFPDRPAFQTFCRESEDYKNHEKSHGFATLREGFAVSFEHEGLFRTAVHETAHLYHGFAYGSHMPSWYDEGYANRFGHRHSTAWDGARLTTARPPTRAAVASLLDGERLVLPLTELLHGDANAEIQKGETGAERFYLQAWALLWFFQSTEDPDLIQRFEDWESFCLGSGYDARTNSSVLLFDRVFDGATPRLEEAFVAWLRGLPD